MKKKIGKLIVFDAIDGAGKTTQVKLLLNHLRREKIKYYLTDFPQYEKSFFGKMVRQYLQGAFGEVGKTDPHLISLLYALDRFEAKKRMWKILKSGRVIVSDRYSPANKIHQASKIKNIRRKDEFLDWLDKVEFGILGIPRPDLVLFLDVPPKITMAMTARRGKQDLHESSLRHQQAAYQESLRLVNKYSAWKKIECLSHGNLLSPEKIHERVWAEVKKVSK
ncbi:MAG: thymidylate kinase [Patescibacteria group bacterium]|jgi:dTMP kinase